MKLDPLARFMIVFFVNVGFFVGYLHNDLILFFSATLMASDEKISTLKDEVEKLRKQWREAQNNYEKQV